MKSGRRRTGKSSTQQTFVEPAPESHQRWAALMKRVYKVDPLECPMCGSEMKIIAFIRDPAVVNRILDHLDMLETSGKDPPARLQTMDLPINESTIISRQGMNFYRTRKDVD